jgi:hypothetical protein
MGGMALIGRLHPLLVHFPIGLVLTAALNTSGLVRADAEDTLNFLVGATVVRDSNVFRLSSGTDPRSVGLTTGKSDTISTAQLGLRVDKTWSQQRLQLDATTTNHRYSGNAFLNFDASNYRGALLYSGDPSIARRLLNQAIDGFTSSTLVIFSPELIRENSPG